MIPQRSDNPQHIEGLIGRDLIDRTCRKSPMEFALSRPFLLQVFSRQNFALFHRRLIEGINAR